MTYFLNFGMAPYLGNVEGRNYKFGTINVDHEITKKCKIASQVVGNRSYDLLLEFCDTLSRKLLKLETSNLEYRLAIKGTNENNVQN